MPLLTVVFGHCNGFISFFSGSEEQEGWTDHLSGATIFHPGQQTLAERLAARYHGKTGSLGWLQGRYPADTTPVPIRCTADEYDAMTAWLI